MVHNALGWRCKASFKQGIGMNSLIHDIFLFVCLQLTRKNLMVKNLKRSRKQVERESGKAEAQKYPYIALVLLTLNMKALIF